MKLGIAQVRRKKGFRSSFEIYRFSAGQEPITVNLDEEITGYSLPTCMYVCMYVFELFIHSFI